jgi:hypothetical protein
MSPNGNKYGLAALKDRRDTLAGKVFDLKRELDISQRCLIT